jgi:hypothetical protein
MEERVMKKWLLVLVLVAALCLPASAFAMKAEGTIKGLFSICEGKTCTPGEELLTAALEEVFVLYTDAGESYLLPNIKTAVLSRLVGKIVRVDGEAKLKGKAIVVNKAEVFEKGKWEVFYTPAMAKKAMEELYHPVP